MFQRRAKIVCFAWVVVLMAWTARWHGANRLGPVLAAEKKQARGRPSAQAVFPFEVAAAYHYRSVGHTPHAYALAPARVGGLDAAAVLVIGEVWAVQGVGRRKESRRGSKLESVVVDTPRCRFSWDIERNRVVASPAHPENLQAGWLEDAGVLLWDGVPYHVRAAELETGIALRHKEVLDGREVEKIIAYYPPDSLRSWISSHGFDPKRHLRYSGTQFRPRQSWFDPKTGRFLGYQCGCKWPSEGSRIDYPEPESVPKELFTFRIPRGAVLEVDDPELRRELEREVHTDSGLRQ